MARTGKRSGRETKKPPLVHESEKILCFAKPAPERQGEKSLKVKLR